MKPFLISCFLNLQCALCFACGVYHFLSYTIALYACLFLLDMNISFRQGSISVTSLVESLAIQLTWCLYTK